MGVSRIPGRRRLGSPNVHAEAAVDACTLETDEDGEAGRGERGHTDDNALT